MFGRSRGLGMAMALAALGSGLAVSGPMVISARDDEWHSPAFVGGNPPASYKRGYAGPGTTAAAIKRASRKARNVRRHKSHMKGD